MKRFFDPVVARILNLISDQLNAEVRDTGTISIKVSQSAAGIRSSADQRIDDYDGWWVWRLQISQ